MALRDTWHRTLVYFGLAEEEDPRYEAVREPEPEIELEDRYRDRPNVRRLQRRRLLQAVHLQQTTDHHLGPA